MSSTTTRSTTLTELPFMSAFPAPDREQWRAAVDKVLKGADFEKKLVGRSSDGIRIEPLYDAAPADGQRALRAQAGRWRVSGRVDHPDPTEANALALADLEGGADTLTLSFAGARAARGYGLAASDLPALGRALDGVMLDLIRLRLDPSPQGRANALLLAEFVASRGLPGNAADIEFGMDPIGALATSGSLAVAWPEVAGRLGTVVSELAAKGFSGPFLATDGRVWHEAGATEAQELGGVLATAVAYLRALEAHGVPLAQARDAIAFTLTADTDEFITIAKLRAARLLWDRVQSACGLEPKPMRLHAETAWRSLTRRDPWVNLLRATIATFSAAVGGADSIGVQPFTAALGLPDGFARRVARNTQLILQEEANLWRVADPAAGAGGFEALTRALCEAGWRKFQDLEAEATGEMPGIVAALANGHVQRGLERERATRAKAVATRREPITGTSEFPNIAEASVSVLEVAQMPARMSESVPALCVEALPAVRLSEAFEALRDRMDALSAIGARPTVFLAPLGSVAGFTARIGFARNLFEAGGLKASVPETPAGGLDTEALVAAFKESGARLACLCGSDESYAESASAAAAALKAAGATLWLAGRPGESETALRAAGIETFVFAGAEIVTILEHAQRIAAPAAGDRA